MNRIIITAAALVFVCLVSCANDTQASGNSSHPKKIVASTSSHPSNVNVHYTYFPRGYCSWRNYCWFGSYRCYGYFTDGCWFYWCETLGGFMPISYMTLYPPTTMGTVPPSTGVAPAGVLPTGAAPITSAPTTTNAVNPDATNEMP